MGSLKELLTSLGESPTPQSAYRIRTSGLWPVVFKTPSKTLVRLTNKVYGGPLRPKLRKTNTQALEKFQRKEPAVRRVVKSRSMHELPASRRDGILAELDGLCARLERKNKAAKQGIVQTVRAMQSEVHKCVEAKRG